MKCFQHIAVALLLLFSNNGFTQSPFLFYKGDNDRSVAIKTPGDWNKKRKQILDSMQAAMGQLPAENAIAFETVWIDSLQTASYTRYTISFLAAKDERVTAYLYIPNRKKITGLFPAMIALHETDSIGKKSVDGQGHNINLAYAKELAEKGFIVLAPDYPSFGDLSNYNFDNDRYQSGTMKSIFDNMRCIDWLLQRRDVDNNKIGIIGHSLGGHTALFTAAFDERIKVTVSSCGFTLFSYYNIGADAEKYYGGRLGPWAQPRYMPLLREKYHLDGNKFPFDFDEVIAAIAPRAVFCSAPLQDKNFDVIGVKKAFENVQPVYQLLNAAKSFLVIYPTGGHDFPLAARNAAYQFMDTVFGNK